MLASIASIANCPGAKTPGPLASKLVPKCRLQKQCLAKNLRFWKRISHVAIFGPSFPKGTKIFGEAKMVGIEGEECISSGGECKSEGQLLGAIVLC